jgi:AcrR family transcriptional regulator
LTAPKPHNEKQRRIKIKKILDSARLVFCRKGFLDVTMQDIIDECGISRGGIYLYFASVDEIFQEVMKQRNKEKFSPIKKAVHDNAPFEDVLADYMNLQKKRLLNFENSIFRAYCEYIFSKPRKAIQAFRDTQLQHLRTSVESILMLGVNQGILLNQRIPQFAGHIIIVIDGLSILALAGALTEDNLNDQFEIINEMIESIRTKEPSHV